MDRDNKPWFAAKRYGYGAGLPIAWQGWALLLGYFALVIFSGLLPFLLSERQWVAELVFFAVILFETVGFCVICARKTEGGWRWRWGEKD